MLEFKFYDSKPVQRTALQITEKHKVEKCTDREATYTISSSDGVVTDTVWFKAYEEPKVGDWVIELTAEDTYHCTDAVFRERNIVPE